MSVIYLWESEIAGVIPNLMNQQQQQQKTSLMETYLTVFGGPLYQNLRSI